MKAFAKKGCGTLIAVVLFLALLGYIFGDPSNDSTTPTSTPATPSAPSTPAATPRPTAPPPSIQPPPASAEPTTPPTSRRTETVLTEIVDGDTVRTSEGTVRIIGIDTPERGECGYADAANEIERAVAIGDPVILELSASQNDSDRYGRLIRYVLTEDGVDIGLMQLEAGHAVARYDSTDGYPSHPQEAEYHAAQIAVMNPDGIVTPPGCDAPAIPEPTADSWWTQYGSCAQLKRNTNGHPTGPFDRDIPAEADIYNWFQYGTGYRGDGDGDGLACE